MNSQQELIDVIKDIAKKQNHTYDTPATVLRVEGDTVWVHIDGGADETPVRKTINCEQGEIVQVRISNGSAFLVGNASAPPTDDKTANVAHFIAEEADIKAVRAENTATEAQATAVVAQETAEEAMTAVAQSLTTYETWYILSATTPTQPTEDSHTGWSTAEPAWSSSSTDKLYFSVRTVKGDGTATWSAVGMVQSYADLQILKNAIISTVANNYVGQGDSGITELSSTMLQNSNGVNIFNDTLAVGDSYAHIDGDSFDIKVCTTAGTIDDANDDIVASFGQESFIKYEYDTQYGHYTAYINFRGNSIKIGEIYNSSDEDGWEFKRNSIETYGNAGYPIKLDGASGLQLGRRESRSTQAIISNDRAIVKKYEADGFNTYSFSKIDESSLSCGTVDSFEATYYHQTEIENGDIRTTGDVYDYDEGYKKTPTILTSTTISSATTSYTFSNASITTDSVIDIYDTIFGFSPTNMTVSAGSCTVTFPAQSSSHQIKLFVY